MSTRRIRKLVAEDDPGWRRFWEVFPWRTAKIEGRAAWAELNPNEATVDAIIHALGWQRPLWTRQGFGQMYPASYLRKQRWTDEPPAPVQAPVTARTARILGAAAEVMREEEG